MNDFFNINSPKLKFAFIVCLTICSLIGLLPTFLIRGLLPIERLLLFLSIGFGFTIFILFLAVVSEYFKFTMRRKVYNKAGINDFLILNKFQTILTNLESKWQLTQELKKAIVNGFPVIADLHKTNSNLLRLDFLIKNIPLSKEKFKELKELFSKYDAEFDFETIGLNISHKKQNSTTELNNKLTEFAEVLVKEGFVPAYL